MLNYVKATVLLMLFMGNARADDKDVLQFDLKEVSVRVYSEICQARTDTGATIFMRPVDEHFVEVRATVVNKTNSRGKIAAKDIFLLDVDGKKYEAAGSDYELSHTYKDFSAPLFLSNNQAPETHSLLYLVPKKTRSFNYHIGKVSKEIVVPDEYTPWPDPKDDVKVEIVSSRLADFIESNATPTSLKRRKIPAKISYPQGQLLEVKFKLTPQRGNVRDSHFVWTTRAIGAIINGVFVSCIGNDGLLEDTRYASSVGTLSRSYNHSSSRGKPFHEQEALVYFNAPRKLESFVLTYFHAPVARGKVIASDEK